MEDVSKNLYVIDASFLLAFLLDENNVEVNSMFERYALGEIVFIAPSILRYEVGNSLRTKFLRRKLTKTKAKKIYKAFLTLHIKEENSDDIDILDAALENNVSFYDSSYVTLAKKLHIKLLTLDQKYPYAQ